ncbi:hypothetical protein B4U79_18262 [Dinothrombium tinctorium]|uniref:NTR domain-containing protein n=1 Tax=Dinothrombium tinctorium TaxID=1965070 RepID=A0A3S3P3N9_9ACAR|nr:hypothetical protein B4U79_18693 [Dinothrombium tinctorium]RWS06394.1 hypothetical protein B4U79_18262 [Dinothrombium tinctorium]
MKILIIILVLQITFTCAFSCTCVPRTPLQKLCESSIILSGRIGKSRVDGLTKYYDINIDEVYKTPTNFTSKSAIVTTPKSSAACGINLRKGTRYLISGQKSALNTISTTICEYVSNLDSLDEARKSAILHLLKLQ